MGLMTCLPPKKQRKGLMTLLIWVIPERYIILTKRRSGKVYHQVVLALLALNGLLIIVVFVGFSFCCFAIDIDTIRIFIFEIF